VASPYSALASKVRAKFPGAYDDLSDDDLGKKVIAKHPEYQDMVKPVAPLPNIKVQTTREADASRFQAATGGKPPLASPVLPYGAAFTSVPRMAAATAGSFGGAKAGEYAGKFFNLSPRETQWLSDITSFLAGGAATKGAGAMEEGFKGATIEAPEKINLPGGFKINRNVPPPPPTPEEAAYTKAKTITEAQEAAQAENVKRGTQAARAKERAYTKEAEDRMAIQRRYDEAQEARVQAEKEAKNNEIKNRDAFEKEMREYETTRQKDLTAAEKLKEQHAQALMRRGKEQAALDKAAGRAREVETAAEAEVRKLPPERPRTSGVRPTASEKFLTNLVKKDIWSPQDLREIRAQLGDDAMPRFREAPTAYRARILGLIRAGRAARGMRDLPSGQIARPPEP